MIERGTPNGKVLILLHGRGGTAENILSLADHLPDVFVVAPQGPDRQWYPHSFLRSKDQNEPQLSESLKTVHDLLNNYSNELGSENVFVAGFSQGACLAAEAVATLPNRYGGVGIFSGGVIGPNDELADFQGDLKRTPVYVGGSENDPFIPKHRIENTAKIFAELNADVTFKVYPGGGHTIMQEEVDWLSSLF